jgi:ribose transport system substrate-binding protein
MEGLFMKKLLALLVAVLMVAAFFGACAKTDTTASTETSAAASVQASTATSAAASAVASTEYNPLDHPIAMGMFLKSHPTVQLMIAGFLVEAKKLGYQPYLFAPDEADSTKAYGLLEAGMAQHKIQGLCQYLFDESTAQYVKKYSDAGVYVVTGHTQVVGDMITTYAGLSAWAACSAVDYGKTAADAIGEQIGGTGTVAVTEGSFNPTEDAAATSFTEEMNSKYPNVKVLDPSVEGFDTPKAIEIATAIIQANPDIKGAFSTTGSGPATWAGAIANTGVKICAIGMDYNKPNLDLLAAGKVYAVVAQPLFQEFAKCADMLDTLLRGGTVPFANLMDAPLVTQANIADYQAYITQLQTVIDQIGVTASAS